MATLIPTVPGVGAALGTGLSKSLEALAQGKIKQMVEGPQNAAFSQLVGSLYPQQGQTQTGQPGSEAAQQGATSQRGGINPGQLTREQAEELAKKLSPSQQQQFFHLRAEALKQNLEQEKFSEKQRTGTRDYNLKVSQEPLKIARDKAEASKKNIDTYERIIAGAESGNLRAGLQHQFLSLFGLQGWGQNVETQLAQADMSQLAQGAGSAFNTRRLTNLEVGTYKNSLATLWNTPEGIVAINKNRILEDRANVVKYDARRKYLKNHKGELPADWEDEAEDMYASDELKSLSQQALKNVQGVGGGASAQGKGSPSAGSSAPSSPEGNNILSQAGNVLGGLAKTVARPVARAVEGALGTVGDIASRPVNLLSDIAGTPKYEDLPVRLPTSQDFREAGKRVYGEALEPKSKVQEFTDTVIQDLATHLAPGAGQVKFLKALTKAVAGEGAAQFVNAMGGGPLAQAGAKLGVSLLAGMPGTRAKLADAENKAYSIAREAAKGKDTSAASGYRTARKVFDEVRDIPEGPLIKARAQTIIDSTAKGGKIPLQEAWDLKKDLGTWRDKAGDAVGYIDRMIGALNSDIQNSGHKDFLSSFNAAEDIHKGLNIQSDVSKFLNKNVDLKKYAGFKSLLFMFGLYHSVPATLGIPAAAFAAKSAAKTIDLITKSSVAAKAYGDVIKFSLLRDATNATRALKRYIKIAENH